MNTTSTTTTVQQTVARQPLDGLDSARGLSGAHTPTSSSLNGGTHVNVSAPALAAALAAQRVVQEFDEHDSVQELRTSTAALQQQGDGEPSAPGAQMDGASTQQSSDAAALKPSSAANGRHNALAKEPIRDEVYRQDVQVAFRSLPDVKPSWSHRYLKMMIVGESGLGKTTFIRNLFAPYAQSSHFPVADSNAYPGLDTFMNAPEKLCTEIVVKDEGKRVLYHYLVQETPSLGDKSTPIDGVQQLLVDYVAAQHRRYRESETSPGRNCNMSELPDPRVDVVLFFIAPHRLKQTEVELMSQLSRAAPVVPILAKADTYTAEELREFRGKVRHILSSVGKRVMHHFSHDALDDAGVRRGCPPFTIICSDKMDLSVGSFWPVREYPWGRCEALNSRHSDMGALRRLLLEVGYGELKRHTEDRYHAFKRQHGAEEGKEAKESLLSKVARLALGSVGVLLVIAAAPAVIDEIVHRSKGPVVHALEGTVETFTYLPGGAQRKVLRQVVSRLPHILDGLLFTRRQYNKVARVQEGVKQNVSKAVQPIAKETKAIKRNVATNVVKLLDEEEVLAPPPTPKKRFLFF